MQKIIKRRYGIYREKTMVTCKENARCKMAEEWKERKRKAFLSVKGNVENVPTATHLEAERKRERWDEQGEYWKEKEERRPRKKFQRHVDMNYVRTVVNLQRKVLDCQGEYWSVFQAREVKKKVKKKNKRGCRGK